MKIKYAVQTHDSGDRDPSMGRYVNATKHEIIVKCVTSLLHSIEYVVKLEPNMVHEVVIIDDHSSPDTIQKLEQLALKYSSDRLTITIHHLEESGLMNSLRKCWESLRDSDADLVYQVQDDYLFRENAIHEMIDIFFQIFRDTNDHPIIRSDNDPHLWTVTYKYISTPRVIVPGKYRYWIQMFDLTCSFLTSKQQFVSNYDVCERFLSYPLTDSNMEKETVNRMILEKGLLALAPIESLAFHLGHITFKEPYIDYKEYWDSVPSL